MVQRLQEIVADYGERMRETLLVPRLSYGRRLVYLSPAYTTRSYSTTFCAQLNCRLLQRHFCGVTPIVTEITLSRMTVELAAMLDTHYALAPMQCPPQYYISNLSSFNKS